MRFLLYSSHYMYHGLVTCLYIHCTSLLYIYDDDVCFSPYLTYVVSFLHLYTFFLINITCLLFTLDALMDLV